MHFIKRRSVVAGLTSLAATSFLTTPSLGQSTPHVGVVGGGIIGASIALHLIASGAKVTLFEKEAIAAGATRNSFAWINASSPDQHYRNLRLASIKAWQELDHELKLGIIWGGALRWQPQGPAADSLQNAVDNLKDTPYALKNLSQDQFKTIAPEFSPKNIGVAAYSSIDGHLDPLLVTEILIRRAVALGATLKMPTTVEGLIMVGDKLQGVKTSEGNVPLDRLVIAAGVDTPELTSMAGYKAELIHAPGILAHTSPVKFSTKKVVYAPGTHFKQFADGRIVGADGEAPPETIVHKLIRNKTIGFPSKAIENMHTKRIIDIIASKFPVAKDATAERLTLGFRPKPKDGYPIIGYLPGSSSIYSAVMHSGITLAPIVGRLVAKEILEDSRQDVLKPYRPERFL